MRTLVSATIATFLMSSLAALADPAPTSTASQPPAPASESDFPRFGFNLGMGFLTASGNRGLLYENSGPSYDLAVLYWYNRQLAFTLEAATGGMAYNTSTENGGHVDVTIQHVEFAPRYYMDLHSLLSRVVPGFTQPFLTLGVGGFSMSKHSLAQNTVDPADIEMGMTIGGGVRFNFVPRLIALELMAKWMSVSFKDSYSQQFQSSNNLPDLTGSFYSWNANLLVTL